MRILTINVVGIPSGSSSDLLEANVFQDYDAVIVNPKNLDDLYVYRNLYHDRNENALTPEAGNIIDRGNQKRREQVAGLLRQGGIVVCFMQPLISYSYNWRYEG
jgi:hypothetical protein